MEATLTCSGCGSAISVRPSLEARLAKCRVCAKEEDIRFDAMHMDAVLKTCPRCGCGDFYCQKDFNRRLGVALFAVAAVLSIWTYGLSFVVLWLADLYLYRVLGKVVVCYKCSTVFRRVGNAGDIAPFDHEKNDRIIYG